MAAKPKAKAKDNDEAELDAADAAAEAEEEVGEGESAAPKRKLPFKLMIIAGAVALILLGGGGTAYFLFGSSRESKAAVPPVKPAVFVDVPDVLVNLSNPGADHTQYLKVKVVLEVPDATLTPQIQNTMPRVMDAFQTYLRELRPSDLDGSAGLYRLKEELTRRVNAAIAPSHVNAVLFKEIVVQ